jgi:hypothetical protein
MALNLDGKVLIGVNDDFLLVDGLEPVQWQRLDDAGAVSQSVDIEKALFRASKKDLLFSERLVTGNQRIIVASDVRKIHCRQVDLGIFVPRKGDLIVRIKDSSLWVYWSIDDDTFDTRFNGVCIRHSALP